MAAQDRDRVCVGAVAGAHGVRGLLRIKSFTATPRDVASYGPVISEDGRVTLTLTVTGEAKGVVLCRAPEVVDRDRADALKGVRLYVDRTRLPDIADAEEYYHADLIGLRAETTAGDVLGRVRAIHDFGAGDVVEIVPEPRGGAPTLVVPFTRAAVPTIDLEGGRLIVDPPAGLLEPGDETEGHEAPDDERMGG